MAKIYQPTRHEEIRDGIAGDPYENRSAARWKAAWPNQD